MELVGLRVSASSPAHDVAGRMTASRPGPRAEREVWDGGRPVSAAVTARPALGRRAERGPLVIADRDSTVYVPSGWAARRDGEHNVWLERVG